MKNLTTLSKIFAVLALMASSIWIGSYLSRLFIVYNLFEAPDLILKSYITDENVNGILSSILPSILIHFISYILMIILTSLFLITCKMNLKMNGWLFIIILAVFLTTPFEIYLMIIDYKIISMLYAGSFNASMVISLLKERIKDLSSFPIVILFTYLSFFYFIVFQPLTKINETKE